MPVEEEGTAEGRRLNGDAAAFVVEVCDGSLGAATRGDTAILFFWRLC